MLWKIVLGLGLTGLLVSIILIFVATKAFYGATDPNIEDLAFAGLIMSVILLIVSFLMAAVSVIFVLRKSKKAWEAENSK